MNPDDIPAGMRLKDLAGWNQTASDWQRFLEFNPTGCFVAEIRGHVVGTVATVVYEERFAWIGMVLVDPDFRGRGIGTRLLEEAIEYLDTTGIRSIKLDATPQGRPIYERLGFESEYEIQRWLLKRLPSKILSTPEIYPVSDIVLKLDREIFCADRSHLLRSLARDASHFTLVTEHHGEVAGYAFGRSGTLADHLGPWVARNEQVAAETLDEFLRRSTRETVFVDFLVSRAFMSELLSARGFKFSRPLTRMVRGFNRYPGRPDLICAILGPEFG